MMIGYEPAIGPAVPGDDKMHGTVRSGGQRLLVACVALLIALTSGCETIDSAKSEVQSGYRSIRGKKAEPSVEPSTPAEMKPAPAPAPEPQPEREAEPDPKPEPAPEQEAAPSPDEGPKGHDASIFDRF